MSGAPRPPLTDDVLIDLIPSRLDALIAALDRRIGAQVDEILHHSAFQRLEAAWRGLWLVVDRTPPDANIRIELLDCSKEDLRRDFESAGEPRRSGLHAHVYARAIGQGHEPYGAVIANYEFEPIAEDVRLLGACASVAILAVAPFIAAASPRFFGVESFPALASLLDLQGAFEQSAPEALLGLRRSEESRAVGLTLPRFLLRAPYERVEGATAGFEYEETIRGHEDMCWGNASFALANRLTDSFARYRWCPNIIGPRSGGLVDGLPCPRGEKSAPTEVAFSERKEFAISECGLIPLTGRTPGEAVFYSANSLQQPKYFGATEEGRAAELNYRLGTQLPYFFIIARVVHYLKVVYRSYLHTFEGRADAERELNDWVGQFVADRSVVPANERGRRPLRKAQVTVTETEHESDWHDLDTKLRPHFKYMGAFFTLSVRGVLEKK